MTKKKIDSEPSENLYEISHQEDMEEKFEAEMDIALLYMFEIFHKYQSCLNTYLDYEGSFDNGPSFHIAINANSKGKLKNADINLEFKNLDKFVKSLQA